MIIFVRSKSYMNGAGITSSNQSGEMTMSNQLFTSLTNYPSVLTMRRRVKKWFPYLFDTITPLSSTVTFKI